MAEEGGPPREMPPKPELVPLTVDLRGVLNKPVAEAGAAAVAEREAPTAKPKEGVDEGSEDALVKDEAAAEGLISAGAAGGAGAGTVP